MSHHTHFVQTRLSIKQHIVTVFEVALNNPSSLQSNITATVVLQVNTLASVTNDITSTGVFIWTVPYQFREVSTIVWRYTLWICKVTSNALGDTNLIKFNVRITRNNCSGRKVNTLTHQVTTQTTLFSFQARTKCFHRSTRRLQRLW